MYLIFSLPNKWNRNYILYLGKACFLQIKLENLYLLMKILNILKYKQMLEFKNDLTAVAHADVT